MAIRRDIMSSLEQTNGLSIVSASPFDPDSLSLLSKLREELLEKYPDELRDLPFGPEEVGMDGAAFFLARSAGQVVGCGAIRPLAPGVAEVKRMFVTTEARGRGVGRALLHRLEDTAKKMGYALMRLETGLKQPEAISLYKSAGYRPCDCFGQYSSNDMSVCFEKRLGG